MILTFNNKSKTGFEKEMELSKQEMELFLLFPNLRTKTSFTNYF